MSLFGRMALWSACCLDRKLRTVTHNTGVAIAFRRIRLTAKEVCATSKTPGTAIEHYTFVILLAYRVGGLVISVASPCFAALEEVILGSAPGCRVSSSLKFVVATGFCRHLRRIAGKVDSRGIKSKPGRSLVEQNSSLMDLHMPKTTARTPGETKPKRAALRLGARAELHRRGMSEAEVNAALRRKAAKRIAGKREF
jgi:hypothetical protein